MMADVIKSLEYFSDNFGDIFLILTIFILFFVRAIRINRRSLSLIILAEYCFSYLLYYSLFSSPFILKVSLGFLYICMFLGVSLIGSGLSIRIISKIYFGIGIYHFLLALEPFLIKLLFVQSQNIIYYIDAIHLFVNFSSNIAIIFLVVFGGYGNGCRKHNIYADCFCDSEYINNYRYSITNQNKKAEKM